MAHPSPEQGWTSTTREVEVIRIPDGEHSILPAGTELSLVHNLGGDYTVLNRHGVMYRIDQDNGDAIGREAPAPDGPRTVPEGGLDEETIRDAMRSCYDPEIPVNLVDLGLIYGTEIVNMDEGGCKVVIKMTLTAPGCGMGQIMVDDIKRRVGRLPTVKDVEIELVFDPPWSPEMLSEAARLQLGMF